MRIHNLIELGAAVRTARLKKTLNQEQLAISIGATQEWVSRLENGRLKNPGLVNVMQALKVVDLPLHLGDIQPNVDNEAFEGHSDLAEGLPSFMRKQGE